MLVSGLARQILPNTEEKDQSNQGSLLYMSPERLHFATSQLQQRSGEESTLVPAQLLDGGSPLSTQVGVVNEKSDIFALGIILFEMFSQFTTESERIGALTTLGRQRKLPIEFVQTFPQESTLILQMLDEDVSKRPTAKELLAHPALQVEFSSKLQSFGTTNPSPSDDEAISQLEQQIKTLQSQLSMIRARNTSSRDTTRRDLVADL